jgi:DNA polymerase III delta subunit
MLGIKQYFLKEYIEAARNYSSIQIAKCFATLLEADETLKSSGRDEKLIMTLMVYKLINNNSVNFEQSKRLSR